MTDQGKQLETEDGAALTEETAEDQARAAAARRVAGWWPKGLAKVSPEPEAVSFTRRSVADWGAPNPAEASQALAACYRYALWLGAEPEPVALTNSVFELEMVKGYLDGPLASAPPPTRKSARTYLRRLDQSRDVAIIAGEVVEAGGVRRRAEPRTRGSRRSSVPTSPSSWTPLVSSEWPRSYETRSGR